MKEIDKIAFIETKNGQILSTRSKGKSTFYIPGGKRDEGESDEETLVREMFEELKVDIKKDTINYIGTFTTQADGAKEGINVKMTCYEAKYSGNLEASSEIEEFRWLSFEDIGLVSPVDKIIFEFLRERGALR